MSLPLSQQMISESFLRNYSIKKILNAAQIQKEKLKVYFAKNIKQVFKRHQHTLNASPKKYKSKQPVQVFYRYTVKHLKSDLFSDHVNIDETQLYKGRPKVPIRCNQISLDLKPKVYSAGKQNILQFIDLFAPSPQRFNLTNQYSRTATTSLKRTPIGFRKKPPVLNKTQSVEDSDILSPKLNDLRMDTKMEETQHEPKICLQNQEIVRCSTAKKTDNFILSRGEALKKSADRGERFRKTLRQKYAKLGLKKQHWTEIDNLKNAKN